MNLEIQKDFYYSLISQDSEHSRFTPLGVFFIYETTIYEGSSFYVL